MLPKKKRIRRTEFPRFSDKKIVWSGAVLRIFAYLKKTNENKTIFAVVVAKKYYPTTVKRNRFKRSLMIALENKLPALENSNIAKYVISPLLPVEKISPEDIVNDIEVFIAQHEKTAHRTR